MRLSSLGRSNRRTGTAARGRGGGRPDRSPRTSRSPSGRNRPAPVAAEIGRRVEVEPVDAALEIDFAALVVHRSQPAVRIRSTVGAAGPAPRRRVGTGRRGRPGRGARAPRRARGWTGSRAPPRRAVRWPEPPEAAAVRVLHAVHGTERAARRDQPSTQGPALGVGLQPTCSSTTAFVQSPLEHLRAVRHLTGPEGAWRAEDAARPDPRSRPAPVKLPRTRPGQGPWPCWPPGGRPGRWSRSRHASTPSPPLPG